MNPTAKRLLEAFDQVQRNAVDLETLLVLAGAGGQRALAQQALAEMLQRGWLRHAESSETYVRTEEGRLALAGPLDITLYTRQGCHLCEEAKRQIAPLIAQFHAKLLEVDVDSDPTLHQLYTNDVPVIFLGSRKVAKHRLNLAQFRRQLERAGR
jgi:glutaredoxin